MRLPPDKFRRGRLQQAVMAAREQDSSPQERERRRAAALRENLRRRKAQQRARTVTDPADPAPAEERPDRAGEP